MNNSFLMYAISTLRQYDRNHPRDPSTVYEEGDDPRLSFVNRMGQGALNPDKSVPGRIGGPLNEGTKKDYFDKALPPGGKENIERLSDLLANDISGGVAAIYQQEASTAAELEWDPDWVRHWRTYAENHGANAAREVKREMLHAQTSLIIQYIDIEGSKREGGVAYKNTLKKHAAFAQVANAYNNGQSQQEISNDLLFRRRPVSQTANIILAEKTRESRGEDNLGPEGMKSLLNSVENKNELLKDKDIEETAELVEAILEHDPTTVLDKSLMQAMLYSAIKQENPKAILMATLAGADPNHNLKSWLSTAPITLANKISDTSRREECTAAMDEGVRGRADGVRPSEMPKHGHGMRV